MLPDWGKIEFHACPAQSWEDLLPAISSNGRDLVRRLLRYQSSERLSADEVSDYENEVVQGRTLMMLGPPTSVFLHHLISRQRWLPHNCGPQPHGTGCGPYLEIQEAVLCPEAVAMSLPSLPRMQRWGRRIMISRDMVVASSLYTEDGVHEVQDFMYILREARWTIPMPAEMMMPVTDIDQQTAGPPKNSSRSSYLNPLIGGLAGNSIYSTPSPSDQSVCNFERWPGGPEITAGCNWAMRVEG